MSTRTIAGETARALAARLEGHVYRVTFPPGRGAAVFKVTGLPGGPDVEVSAEDSGQAACHYVRRSAAEAADVIARLPKAGRAERHAGRHLGRHRDRVALPAPGLAARRISAAIDAGPVDLDGAHQRWPGWRFILEGEELVARSTGRLRALRADSPEALEVAVRREEQMCVGVRLRREPGLADAR